MKSFTLLCFVAMFAIMFAHIATAQNPIIQLVGTPMAATGLKSQFTGNFTCDLTCGSIDSMNFTFPSGRQTTNIGIQLVYATPEASSTWENYQGSITTGTSYKLPTIPTNLRYVTVYFFIDVEWAASYYSPPYAEYTTTNINMQVLYYQTPTTLAPLYPYTIAFMWGTDLSLKEPTQTEIDPLSFAAQFDTTYNRYTRSDLKVYKTILSFTNYNDKPVKNFDLILSGTSYWMTNGTTTADFCSINGQWINPSAYVNNQTLSFAVPEAIVSTTTQNSLITIVCGDETHGLPIVADPSIVAKLATKPSETLSIVTKFDASDDYQHLFYTYSLNSGEYDLSKVGVEASTNMNVTPLYTFVDRRLGVNGAAAISSMLEFNFNSFADYQRPFEISVEVYGLEKDTEKEAKTKMVPRVIVSIEPDYTVETIPNRNIKKAPATPRGLVTSFYILPFDLDRKTTPTLTVEKGFLDTYTDEAPQPFESGNLPKRYISVIIPLDPIKVTSYPLSFGINIRYIDAEGDKKHKPALLTLAVVKNEAAEKDPKAFFWRSKSIQKSRLSFDVHPVSKGQFGRYPDLLTAQYPLLKYRYAFSDRRGLYCAMYYQYCFTTYSYSTGTTRSCRFIPDNDAYYSLSFKTQSRVDLAITAYSPNYSPNGWRRLECEGAFIIEQKPYVKDFRTSTDQAIKSNSAKTEDVSYGWAKVSQSSVSSVVNHHFTRNGETVGYTEAYNLKNRLSTGVIIALCLIPLYILALFFMIWIPYLLCCKD